MTDRHIVTCRAAALRYHHFAIADRQNRRPLWHRKINATVRRNAPGQMVFENYWQDRTGAPRAAAAPAAIPR
mgnify:CR=1 FL=1